MPHRIPIINAVARHRLPAVYPFRYFATAGGLAAYGVSLVDQYRRAASYVDRILRGASPSDLPVQAPDKFELVLNLKTARAQGIDISPILLARADEASNDEEASFASDPKRSSTMQTVDDRVYLVSKKKSSLPESEP